MSKKSEEVAVRENHSLSEDVAGVFDVKDNLDGITPRLPQVSVAHQAQVFKWPDGTKKESFEGIILDTNAVNAWWAVGFSQSGGGTPPDCSSLNGIKPDPAISEPQSPLCAMCEHNRFGSDGKRGKACKNMRRVHIMLEDENLPKRLTLPPSSIRSFEDYLTNLADQGVPYQLAVTRFSLSAASNKDGIEYSEVHFEKVATISAMAEAEQIKAMRDTYLAAMRGQGIEADEASAKQDDTGFDDQF